MELNSILNQSLLYVSSCALRCAVELDISGCIQAYGGPMPLNELARSIPIPPEKDMMLGRLMELLVQKEVFAETEAGYVLTPISKLLLADGSNLGAYVICSTELQMLKHMYFLSSWFKASGPDTAFMMVNDGKHPWDNLKDNPQLGKMFNEAMASHSKHKIRELITKYPHILDGISSLVDVGGGTGTAVKIIADSFPSLTCTVLDLPHVIDKVSKDELFNAVAGDMFENIPSADAILLNNVLHDWSDDDCVRLLKRCKEAIEPKKDGSKVLVVDIVQDIDDNPKAAETGFLFDIVMMSVYASKERKKQEWEKIILEAGYSGYKIYPDRLGADSVMELYP